MPHRTQLGQGTERPHVLAVGIGGAGCNTLRAISPSETLERFAVNDLPHPSMAGIKRRVFLEKTGLREIASMDETAVRALATTAEQAIAVEMAEADLVVPIAGLGGEMGSWGASLVARVGALKGATVLAVATTPFSAEGMNRRGVAEEALRVLRTHAHGVLAMPNDPLLKLAPNLPLLRAFEVLSRLAVQPIQDLVRVMTREDLAALKAHLRVAKDWRLGIGEGFVDHPELAAVEAAFRSPWIPRDPVDARGVLLLMSLPEVSDWMTRAIVEDVDLRAPRADVLWGAFEDPAADRVRVSVLLGF
ncbi:MAG: hypothetical protein E6K18_05155 [Methanobacteriota archaeon]|nr:MAG: hypothetical protein E6K18_05155 [Euryarchaeota archaeon]